MNCFIYFTSLSIHLSVRKSREKFQKIYGKSKANFWGNLNTGTPRKCFSTILCFVALVYKSYFFRTAVLRTLFHIRFSFNHCNFSHVCLLVKMGVENWVPFDLLYRAFNFKWTKFRPFFILVQFNMNKITILWSFSSIEASISEIFAIKNCYFLGLILVERSEKLSAKTACDVNVGQVKKSGKFKTKFFESTGHRNYGSLCGHKPGKNKQFVFKSCKPWL